MSSLARHDRFPPILMTF